MENQNFYNHLIAEETRLMEVLSQIQGLIRYYGGSNEAGKIAHDQWHSQKPLTATVDSGQQQMFPLDPTQYNKRAIIPEKVLFALKAIGSGTSREVGLKLRELDGSFTESKAIDNARFHLSALAKENRVHGEDIPGMKGKIYSPSKEEAAIIAASE